MTDGNLDRADLGGAWFGPPWIEEVGRKKVEGQFYFKTDEDGVWKENRSRVGTTTTSSIGRRRRRGKRGGGATGTIVQVKEIFLCGGAEGCAVFVLCSNFQRGLITFQGPAKYKGG
ncbi:hypothetical protein R1flu_019957 [Riccia fluitans]|uniref:Uncharacterized protein n=1 Tax=Riccia fluitans TaxID=41844 RepID=A0ABD1ZNY4_9MARC